CGSSPVSGARPMALREGVTPGGDKASGVRAMFSRIAPRYDVMNALMTGGRDQTWRREAARLAAPAPGSVALDLATGTGDLALARLAPRLPLLLPSRGAGPGRPGERRPGRVHVPAPVGRPVRPARRPRAAHDRRRAPRRPRPPRRPRHRHHSRRARPLRIRDMPFLSRPSCELYYETHGSGPALVFAHGLGGSHLSWWQQIPHFRERYTCVIFAHRGFGPSREAPGGPGPPAVVEDL